jgi:multidrug efflux system outer membrane protein
MHKLSSLPALAALASCSFIPAYERPAAPVAAQFPGASAGAGAPASDRGWRDVFGDPRLDAMIKLALDNNRDLRVAVLNVELAAAEHRIQHAALLPSVAASGGATWFGTKDGLVPGSTPRYQAGVSMSYELDLFGRVRSLTEQALEQYLATAEARRAAHLTLVASVASQYLTERALDEQLALARQTLASVEASSLVTQRLFEAGRRSELDAATAEGQIETARAEVARLSRAQAEAQNALVLLVGQPLPADLPAAQALDHPGIVADLPAGVPSDLLARRPDILAAEHALLAANANIGAARAAFFPRISLTALAGLASNALSNLFTAGAFSWTAGPSATVPIFDGGANAANLDAAKVRKAIQIAQYEKAIQTAFREVADGLVARGYFVDQLTAQTARVAAEQRRFTISETRYASGLESYVVVLLAQQELYAAQQQLVDVRLASLTSAVDVYRALGGGWLERRGSAAPPAR